MQESDKSERRERVQTAPSATGRDPSVKSAEIDHVDKELTEIIEHLESFAFSQAHQFLFADWHEAEHVAQESLICLTQLLLRGIRPDIEPNEIPFEHFKPMLREIVRRTALAHARELRKWRWPSSDAMEMQSSSNNTLSADDNDEVASDLRSVCDLPDRMRYAIVLKFYEHKSTEEIAQILGAQPNTVNAWIRKGVERLRTVLKRETVK